jgi:hypothetical protein
VAANPFYPTMTHFTLPLHATREELIGLAAGWAQQHSLHVGIERYFPHYSPAAVPLGGDLHAAIAEHGPVRRICLGHQAFDVQATNEIEHLGRNPNSFVIVLEPLSEDGLRATALTGRMGDEEVLRWWVALVREAIAGMHQGAWATVPSGGRTHLPDHFHTVGAHDLAADDVPMLAATGDAVFEFEDLA